MTNSDLIDIQMYRHAQTEKAILVSDDGEEESAVWLPLSQVEIEEKGGNELVITMPEWLAINKEIY
jgi:hypothetical protein